MMFKKRISCAKSSVTGAEWPPHGGQTDSSPAGPQPCRGAASAANQACPRCPAREQDAQSTEATDLDSPGSCKATPVAPVESQEV